jgi:hypothetical protein
MKILKWSEVLKLKGDVVYLPLEDLEDGSDPPTIVYDMNQSRICSEHFPIVIPDYEDCFDYFSTIDKLKESGKGVVSDLETSGDVTNRYHLDKLIVVYDREDINQWILKLNSINIQY